MKCKSNSLLQEILFSTSISFFLSLSDSALFSTSSIKRYLFYFINHLGCYLSLFHPVQAWGHTAFACFAKEPVGLVRGKK